MEIIQKQKRADKDDVVLATHKSDKLETVTYHMKKGNLTSYEINFSNGYAVKLDVKDLIFIQRLVSQIEQDYLTKAVTEAKKQNII